METLFDNVLPLPITIQLTSLTHSLSGRASVGAVTKTLQHCLLCLSFFRSWSFVPRVGGLNLDWMQKLSTGHVLLILNARIFHIKGNSHQYAVWFNKNKLSIEQCVIGRDQSSVSCMCVHFNVIVSFCLWSSFNTKPWKKTFKCCQRSRESRDESGKRLGPCCLWHLVYSITRRANVILRFVPRT